LTEHDAVITIASPPAPGAAFSARARGGRLSSYATAAGNAGDLVNCKLITA